MMAAEHDEVPLNAIRAFVTIAREGSVTRAARTSGTTQSSISRYRAVLQNYLGTDLVERCPRRRPPTISTSHYPRLIEPADDWEIYNEAIVCVGSPNHVAGRAVSIAFNATSQHQVSA
ncbi:MULTISPECIES: LysR family transcriptional regulator [unclassified Bradyrhizobium]|uniref:helix-turn-helix domain-containing protein n=1 Tax=unclassified Bradyrhizobium TaxID=2631580 RepID=UPI0032096A06